MKFTAQIPELRTALTKAASAIPSKSTLAQLETVLVELTGNELKLTGTDLEIRVTATLEVSGKKAGKASVPAKLFSEIVKALPAGELTFVLDGNRATLQTEQGNYTLTCETEAALPVQDFTPEHTLNLTTTDLARWCHYTLFATSTDDLRPSMQGMYTNFAEGYVVATDGHRLSTVTIDKREGALNIPTRVLSIALKSFSDESLTVNYSEQAVEFVGTNTQVWSRLIDEHYPNWEAVVPKENDKTLSVNRQSFIASLKRVMILSNANTKQVKLELSHNKLTILADNFDSGSSARETLACGYDADPLTIGFNGHFLEDALSHMKSQTVTAKFSTPTRAVILEGDADVMQLVMPVRLNV